MPIYGHRQLGFFFFPLVETRENGLMFKRKWYAWSDVARVNLWETEFPRHHYVPAEMREQIPHAVIMLTDGRRIELNGRTFEKQDEPLAKGYVSAFNEFIDFVQTGVRHHAAATGR